MAVGRLLSLVRRRGTHCQNVYVTSVVVLLFLAVFSKHSFSQSTGVSSALEALAMMRYINPRFTLHYIRNLGYHIVLDGHLAPPKGAQPPVFSPCLLCPNGRPSQLLLSSCNDTLFV